MEYSKSDFSLGRWFAPTNDSPALKGKITVMRKITFGDIVLFSCVKNHTTTQSRSLFYHITVFVKVIATQKTL